MHPYLERLEKEAAKAEGVNGGLTVADVLKNDSQVYRLTNGDYELIWNDTRWQIWRGGGLHFESPDESAAVAEFLRMFV